MNTSIKKNSVLWSIKFPNKNAMSFLLGTMHVDTAFTQEVYHAVLPYISQCKYFYTEIDFSELQSSEDMSKAYFAPVQYNIREYLSSPKYNKLKDILRKSFDVNLDHIAHMKAIFIVNVLAEKVLSQYSNKSLDLMLSDYAVEQLLTVGGIEKVQDQLDVTKHFDNENHIRQLLSISRNPSRFRKSILSLNKYYLQQDIVGLYRSSKKSLGNLKHVLLYDRNKKMSQSIKEKAHLGTSFFAFGAGHLSGKYGILRYLKHEEAILTPIRIF